MTNTKPVLAGLVLGLAPLLLLAPILGCGGSSGPAPPSCALHDPGAIIDVSGAWSYQGTSNQYFLIGTITFSQAGNFVTVTRTEYDNAGDRELESQATALSGNRLDVTLVPINGDTNYTADVTFFFNAAGTQFCVAFSDTNNDSGTLGSYVGTLDP